MKEYFQLVSSSQNEQKDAFLSFDEEKSGLDSFFVDLVHENATWRFSKPDCAGLSLRLCLLCLKGEVTAERGIFVNK